MNSNNTAMLFVHKEPQMTSFDVLRRLKKILGRSDIGHGGTLDRFASGLLPVFMGEGLKLSRFLFESYPALPVYWKAYEGTIRFGTKTDTADLDGALVETKAIPGFVEEDLKKAFNSFVGINYEQMPPAYSAKKVNGERSSDLTRAGKEPVLKAVPVQIKSFELTGVSKNAEGLIEEAQFRVVCSKGTYVRVLATDVAVLLGTVAHLKTLVRTAIGDWKLESAVTLARLEALKEELDASHDCSEFPFFLTLAEASSFLPHFPLLGAEADQLTRGRVADTCARLANSRLPANAYCAVSYQPFTKETSDTEPVPVPRALIELSPDFKTKFLRAFC